MHARLSSLVPITILLATALFSSCQMDGALSPIPSSPNNEPTPGPKVGAIAGRAVFNHGDDHSGIRVSAERLVQGESHEILSVMGFVEATQTSVMYHTYTDQSGGYALEELPIGTYTVYASSDDSLEKAVATSVVVQESTESTLDDLFLTPTGSLTGTVSLENESLDHSGVLVGISGTSFLAMTDQSGGFSISSVPANPSYVLVFYKEGYEQVQRPVSVAARETVSVEPVFMQSNIHVPSVTVNLDSGLYMIGTVVITWQPVSFASRYEVQIAVDAEFSDLVIADDHFIGTRFVFPHDLIRSSTNYHFRVRARAFGVWEDWEHTTTRTFRYERGTFYHFGPENYDRLASVHVDNPDGTVAQTKRYGNDSELVSEVNHFYEHGTRVATTFSHFDGSSVDFRLEFAYEHDLLSETRVLTIDGSLLGFASHHYDHLGREIQGFWGWNRDMANSEIWRKISFYESEQDVLPYRLDIVDDDDNLIALTGQQLMTYDQYGNVIVLRRPMLPSWDRWYEYEYDSHGVRLRRTERDSNGDVIGSFYYSRLTVF